jgi:hypothetical protein
MQEAFMSQESTPFPNHQFDFADIVFVQPLQKQGPVAGIVYRNQLWYYLVAIESDSDDWWREDQLAFSAPESTLCDLPPFIAADLPPENPP